MDQQPNILESLKSIDVSDGDLEAYLKSLDNLTLLEASSMKREIDGQVHEWEACKGAIDNLDTLVDDNGNKVIVKANLLQSIGIDSEEEFIKDYERTHKRYEAIQEKLLDIINSYKDQIDSSKFMTDQMLIIVRKNIANLSHEHPNYDYIMRALKNVERLFVDRLEGSHNIHQRLYKKLVSYCNTHGKEISRSFSGEAKQIAEDRKTNAIKVLCNKFSPGLINQFTAGLYKIFNDANMVHLFILFLAHVLKNDTDDNREDELVKIFILDVNDNLTGSYDIPQEKPYTEIIADLFSTYLSEYLQKKKLHLTYKGKAITTSNFGLTPNKKKDGTITI